MCIHFHHLPSLSSIEINFYSPVPQIPLKHNFNKITCSKDCEIIKYNYKVIQKLPEDGLPETITSKYIEKRYEIMKWNAVITETGSEVMGLLRASNQVDFRPNDRPTDLADYSVSYEGRPSEDLKKGDRIEIGSSSFRIVGLGANVNEKLQTRGTCTMNFSEKHTPATPDSIMLSGIGYPETCIKNGAKISVK